MAAAKHKSRTVSKRDDPRAAASRERIRHAFVALMHRRPYAALRVSDVCRKAGVGRATFYAHFATKDALLREELGRIVRRLVRPAPDGDGVPDCTALFAHVRDAPQIYRSLTRGPSRLVTEQIVMRCLEERLCPLIPNPGRGGSIRAAVAVRFAAASLLTVLAWWLENDTAAPPDELQAAFESLVAGGLRPGPP
jgi:AcrR family transcriptional regulator